MTTVALPHEHLAQIRYALRDALNAFAEAGGLIEQAYDNEQVGWWEGCNESDVIRELVHTNGLVGGEGDAGPRWVRTVRRVYDALVLLGELPPRRQTQFWEWIQCSDDLCPLPEPVAALCPLPGPVAALCPRCIMVPFADPQDPMVAGHPWPAVELHRAVRAVLGEE